MIQRKLILSKPHSPYTSQFKNLVQVLWAARGSLSFGVRFQLQRLAQNGYLSPLKVIGLFPEVVRLTLRSGNRVCVNTVRRLFRQIPYSGPDVDAKYFGLDRVDPRRIVL
jgi:hypothetical protein